MPAIREANVNDIPVLLSFIKELALYEKLGREVVTTEELLKKTLFGDHPKAFALMAEHDDKPAGFCIYSYAYSTFYGRHSILVNDMYICPQLRGKSCGSTMLQYLAKKAVAEGCGRMEWRVQDWNQSAMDFYRKMDAETMDNWTVFRVKGPTLRALAEKG